MSLEDTHVRILVREGSYKTMLCLYFKKAYLGDFPGGPVVKNPPSNEGDAGSIPGRGLSSHMPRRATKSAYHNYWATNYRAHVPQLERKSTHHN